MAEGSVHRLVPLQRHQAVTAGMVAVLPWLLPIRPGPLPGVWHLPREVSSLFFFFFTIASPYSDSVKKLLLGEVSVVLVLLRGRTTDRALPTLTMETAPLMED